MDPDRSDFAHLSALVRSRRTSMIVDPQRSVPAELVTELCELATWAPNHKKTWPWRFALFSGEGRTRLGAAMADEMEQASFGDDAKRAKTRSKYLRTPSVLVVGCAPHDDEMLDAENRDAVAAGIQNLLLGATALGLASFWSTPALARPPAVLELCGFDPDDRLVGVVYLGWAAQECAAPQRPAPRITLVGR
ncbi:MAG TPA: nitroreductase [Ilumatobacteraceae bacterium]|nr:nitroreductase [Ilumatobacteraceae bacterium]